MERCGVDQPGRQESRARCIREKPRHEIEWLVHTAEAVEHHRFDGVARAHHPRVWIVWGRSVHDLTDAECIEPARDKAKMIEDLTPIKVWPGVLLPKGDATDLPKLLNLARGTAECRMKAIVG